MHTENLQKHISRNTAIKEENRSYCLFIKGVTEERPELTEKKLNKAQSPPPFLQKLLGLENSSFFSRENFKFLI